MPDECVHCDSAPCRCAEAVAAEAAAFAAQMQEVCCQDCGVSLGYQQADTEIRWEMWRHNRCPVRLARNLGVDAELYGQLLGVLAVTIVGCYPDFPNNVIDEAGKDDFRHMRGTIAAGAVLEVMGTVLKLKISKAEPPAEWSNEELIGFVRAVHDGKLTVGEAVDKILDGKQQEGT